jgi:hypothetical protein
MFLTGSLGRIPQNSDENRTPKQQNNNKYLPAAELVKLIAVLIHFHSTLADFTTFSICKPRASWRKLSYFNSRESGHAGPSLCKLSECGVCDKTIILISTQTWRKRHLTASI